MKNNNRLKKLVISGLLFWEFFHLSAQHTFQKLYDGNHHLNQLTATSDSGFIGAIHGPIQTPWTISSYEISDAGLVKLNKNHEIEWTHFFSTEGVFEDAFIDVVELQGFYFVSGKYNVQNLSKNVIVKLDQQGNEIWTKELFEGKSIEISRIEVIDDQLWVLVKVVHNGFSQAGIIVLNTDGELLNQKFYLTQENTAFYGVEKYKENYYLSGISYVNNINQELILLKLNPQKEVIWFKEYESEYLICGLFNTNTKLHFVDDNIYLTEWMSYADKSLPTNMICFKINTEGHLIKSKLFTDPTDLDSGSKNTTGSFSLIYQDKIYVAYENRHLQNFNYGLLTLDLELEMQNNKNYQLYDRSLHHLSNLILEEDGFLIAGNQHVYRSDYSGFFLSKINFDGNSSCNQFDFTFNESEIQTDFTELNVSYTPFAFQNVLSSAEWDSTYTSTINVSESCEKDYFSLHLAKQNNYCMGDEVTVRIFGKESDISWNLDSEQILEETDDSIRYVLTDYNSLQATHGLDLYDLQTPISCEGNKPSMKVNELLSPNNDGINDYFKVENIEFYPDCNVLLADRWGNVILESSNYKNDWSGIEVPQGTYHYFIKKNDTDSQPLKGLLIIKY